MLGLPLDHIDDETWETIEKIQEINDKAEEFWKLVEEFNEPKVKIWTSDGTSDWPIAYEWKECPSSIDGSHAWVLDDTTTMASAYKCAYCNAWKTETWNYDMDYDYYYSTYLLGC